MRPLVYLLIFFCCAAVGLFLFLTSKISTIAQDTSPQNGESLRKAESPATENNQRVLPPSLTESQPSVEEPQSEEQKLWSSRGWTNPVFLQVIAGVCEPTDTQQFEDSLRLLADVCAGEAGIIEIIDTKDPRFVLDFGLYQMHESAALSSHLLGNFRVIDKIIRRLIPFLESDEHRAASRKIIDSFSMYLYEDKEDKWWAENYASSPLGMMY